MIERKVLPPIRDVVASFAAFAEPALVRILLAVTGDAGRCKLVSIEIAGVAGIAFDPGVPAAQRKSGLVVIEVRRLPAVLVVAGLAFGAIAIGMHILQPVA